MGDRNSGGRRSSRSVPSTNRSINNNEDDSEETPLIGTPRSIRAGASRISSWAQTEPEEAHRMATVSSRSQFTIHTARPEDLILEKKATALLLLYFVLLVVTGSTSQVMFIIQEEPMRNYPWFLFFYPTGVFLLMCVAYVLPAWCLAEDKSSFHCSSSQWYFFAMGFLDTLSGLLIVLATLFIESGSVNVLLQQSAVPITMVLSLICLKTHYSLWNYIGACVVMVAVMYVLITPPDSNGFKGFYLATFDIMWGGILIAAQFPAALSTIMREKVLKSNDHYDVIHMNMIITIYQLLWGLALMFPLVYLWQYGLGKSDSYLQSWGPIQQLPNGMTDGWMCYIGQNVEDGDTCDRSPYYVNGYIVTNGIFNVVLLLSIKQGSATLAFLVLTALVPLNDLVFAIPGIPKHGGLNVNDLIGLGVIMLGLIVYRFFDPLFFYMLGGKAKLEQREANIAAHSDLTDEVSVVKV